MSWQPHGALQRARHHLRTRHLVDHPSFPDDNMVQMKAREILWYYKWIYIRAMKFGKKYKNKKPGFIYQYSCFDRIYYYALYLFWWSSYYGSVFTNMDVSIIKFKKSNIKKSLSPLVERDLFLKNGNSLENF